TCPGSATGNQSTWSTSVSVRSPDFPVTDRCQKRTTFGLSSTRYPMTPANPSTCTRQAVSFCTSRRAASSQVSCFLSFPFGSDHSSPYRRRWTIAKSFPWGESRHTKPPAARITSTSRSKFVFINHFLSLDLVLVPCLASSLAVYSRGNCPTRGAYAGAPL